MKRTALAIAITATLITSLPVTAEVALHTFRPGERARAADVNGNFTNLKDAIEAAEQRNLELTKRILDLEAALENVLALNGVISLETHNNVPTVRLTGVNLQIVNGTNRTEAINGTGNLIVGYDEPNTIVNDLVCSQATANNGARITDEAGCLAAGGVFANQHKSGSHNLVLGSQNNYSSAAGVVAGRANFINEIYASNLGGVANIASGRFSVIVAGSENRTFEASAAVLGGAANSASGRNSTVSGGSSNVASEVGATVSGGSRNTASASTSAVSGGTRNTASGQFSSISGGTALTANTAAQTLP